MDGFDGLTGVGAAGNVGLVGDDDESESMRLEIVQRRRDPGQKFEFFRAGRRKRLAVAYERRD